MKALQRVGIIRHHLSREKTKCHMVHRPVSSITKHVEVKAAPPGCEEFHSTLLTSPALAFVAEMVRHFDLEVDLLLGRRKIKKLELDRTGKLPDFLADTENIRTDAWAVRPLPRRLQCRHVDLGDVSPSDTEHFIAALKSTAQGIQTDFDDGHCPVWANQLKGLFNVYRAAHNQLPGMPSIADAPVLMMRPRAWNMVENNMLVDGKVVPGPLFDFGLLMYHNATKLLEAESGPFFYLSKLEGYKEARLWNDIFVWTQNQLGIPVGTIKACVLIENVLASFEMEEILYELRDHSAGLNCGIWDYSASFVNKFGERPDFVIPDRSKYVSMDRHFLKSHMLLLIQICHRHNALATGGMAALLLPPGGHQRMQTEVIDKVVRGKLIEILARVDGFMVYDLGLVGTTQALFKKHAPTPNQIHVKRSEGKVQPHDLLLMPSGGVTLNGLKHNIGVGILFICAWLNGHGHFYFKGAVEDSATAEISRSQVWQWIRHQACLEDGSKETITRDMVHRLIKDFVQETFSSPENNFQLEEDRKKLLTSAEIFEEVATKRSFPEFITTYLYEEHAIRHEHGM